MRYEEIETFCLSLRAATTVVQWGGHHVFKVGDKMFALLGNKSEKPQSLSFKVSDDSFHILTQMPHIIPAPYLARAKWVCLQRLNALTTKELKGYLARAHTLVACGLSKSKKLELGLTDIGV